jgi:hypothetical protein
MTVPAVYVTIEDRSFSTPGVRSGRSGLVVVLSDRGPHNRVVEINSLQDFITIFGKPNITKYGQAHYLAAKFLERSSQLYVIRPSILDSSKPENNASIANQYIKYNDPKGSEQLMLVDKFIFTNQADAISAYSDEFVSKYVFTNKDGFNLVEVNDYIYSEKDSIVHKVRVIGKGQHVEKGTYYLELDIPYAGTSTVDINNGNALLANPDVNDPTVLTNYVIDINNIFTTRIYNYYPGSFAVTGSYQFTENSDIVIADSLASFNEVSIEDWIYPDSADSKFARQVITKDISDSGEYQLLLDMNYEGSTSVAAESISKFVPFELISAVGLSDERSIDTQDSDNLWYFYAKGTGTYYNRIFIRAVRNVYYEKMFMDSNGSVIYKYAFMDITVYQSNDDGTSTILEGPWTVSLMNRAGEQTVKDLSSGKELYIVKVINERSKLISCKESEFAATMLEGANVESEYKRLQIQSIFSSGSVNRLKTKGMEGFFLENGSDGVVFDVYGRANLDNEELLANITRCYDGSFTSVDGSIESTVQSVYPWYLFDYILCGGYPLSVQEAAVDLADQRHDCLVLADTGVLNYDAETDISIRNNFMTWNTWNAMIYTQYREIFDRYSGKKIWVSPTYHAIDCHLRVDNESWISDPVAGYVKGSVNDAMTLSYKSDLFRLEKMIDVELNATIVEPDGRYFLTQFTTYKPLSVMKRANTVKFVHHLYKTIPKLLKDILQQKANAYWIGQSNTRVSSYMNNFTKSDTKYESISGYSVDSEFSEDSSELYVGLTIKPLRTIEVIRVNIIVT